MKEKPRIQFLWLLLVILISFFILIVSASSVSAQFVIYSVHTPNNYYTAELTNDNYVVVSQAGQQIGSIKFDRQVGSIAISSDGQNLAVGCEGGDIYYYSTPWSVTFLWKRTFGTATIRSISFKENTNFIDATNTLNQEYLISRTGNLVSEPTTPVVTAIPTISSSVPKNPTSTDYSPVTTNSFESNIYVWVLIALIVLVVFWAVIKSRQKKGSGSTYQPSSTNANINIETIPSGAEIHLNGSYAGISPFTMWALNPGTYSLKSSLNGYYSDTRQITISAGQTFVYSPTLRKIPSPPHQPQPQEGIIIAKVIPSGTIFIDGLMVGVSPVTISKIKPGSHTIEATWNGYYSDMQKITISAGQTFVYSPTLRKLSPTTPTPPPIPHPPPRPLLSFQEIIAKLGAKAPQEREEAQKQLIIKINTDGKPAIQQIIKELEKQPSGVKREIANLLYYFSKESKDGQKVTEELILALTYSSPEVKWLIIQTLGRLKDKRALSALKAAVSDTDFLVKYWAIISLKSIQES